MQSTAAVKATTQADFYQVGLEHKRAQRFDEARQCFEQGCKENSAKCHTEMGMIHYKAGDHAKAFECFSKGDAGGHDRARYMKATLLAKGSGVAKDLKGALELFGTLIGKIADAQTQYDFFAEELKQSAPAEYKPDLIRSNPNLRGTIKEIPYAQLTYGRRLGAGYFGEVFEGTWQRSRVAIKQLQATSAESEAQRKELVDEASVLYGLNSPRVVRLFGLSETPTKALIMVMEFAELGNLNSLLRKQKLSWSVKISLCADIAAGLGYLHENGVLHRDVKAENILVALEEGEYRAKIGDLGLAKVKHGDNTTLVNVQPQMVGRTYGLPPEFKGKGKSFVPTAKSDVYGFGGVCLEIVTHSIDVSEENIPGNTPEILKSAIVKCRSIDPDLRPTAYEVSESLGAYKVEDAPRETTEFVLTSDDDSSSERVKGYLEYGSPRGAAYGSDESGFYSKPYGNRDQTVQYAAMYQHQDGHNNNDTNSTDCSP